MRPSGIWRDDVEDHLQSSTAPSCGEGDVLMNSSDSVFDIGDQRMGEEPGVIENDVK